MQQSWTEEGLQGPRRYSLGSENANGKGGSVGATDSGDAMDIDSGTAPATCDEPGLEIDRAVLLRLFEPRHSGRGGEGGPAISVEVEEGIQWERERRGGVPSVVLSQALKQGCAPLLSAGVQPTPGLQCFAALHSAPAASSTASVGPHPKGTSAATAGAADLAQDKPGSCVPAAEAQGEREKRGPQACAHWCAAESLQPVQALGSALVLTTCTPLLPVPALRWDAPGLLAARPGRPVGVPRPPSEASAEPSARQGSAVGPEAGGGAEAEADPAPGRPRGAPGSPFRLQPGCDTGNRAAAAIVGGRGRRATASPGGPSGSDDRRFRGPTVCKRGGSGMAPAHQKGPLSHALQRGSSQGQHMERDRRGGTGARRGQGPPHHVWECGPPPPAPCPSSSASSPTSLKLQLSTGPARTRESRRLLGERGRLGGDP